MATIRERANGTVELRITHRLLSRPYYSTHDSRDLAEAYSERLTEMLGRGEVPPELSQRPGRSMPLRTVLSEYLTRAPIATSDRPMVEHLQAMLHVDISSVTVKWTDEWVAGMKTRRLAPGTIRKRVGTLARAIDWWHRQQSSDALNPLRTLPIGYSAYSDDVDDAPVDVKRDRRLAPGESERIEAAINGEKHPDRQRPIGIEDRPAFLLLYRVLVHTGLRLQEAYSIRDTDVRFDMRTIHVPRSKTGKVRDVPMSRQVYNWLKAGIRPGLIFPFWNGEEETRCVATRRLSQQFRSLFQYAGCDDLKAHDLRHEAVCRWMLMRDGEGRFMFRPEEVRRITGHQSVQQFERYLSLRGSDLAERMW